MNDTPPLAKNRYPWLLAADALAVAAVYFFYSQTPPTETVQIAAFIGVVAAGLFVAVPYILELLRDPPPAPLVTNFDKNFNQQFENQKILQDDIRSLGDALFKKLTALENRAASPVPAHPALGEIADQLAALTGITGEDGDLPRLRASIEEIQAQLDLFADAIRNLETKLDNSAGAPLPEKDGPLPASLMAKAFAGAGNNTAVARLIGNGTRKNGLAEEETASTDIEHDIDHTAVESDQLYPVEQFATGEEDFSPPPPAHAISEKLHSENTVIYEDPDDDISPPATYPKNNYTHQPRPGAMPAEDELWGAAEEMASGENPAQPDMLGELGLSPDSPKPARRGKRETTLVINAIIGIGNKPYIRGTGPGLDPETGIPMEYVGIGKWRWIAPDSSQPAVVSIWRNDITRAKGADIELNAGGTTEANPVFPEE